MPSVWRMDGKDPIVLKFPEHATHGSFSDGDIVALASNGKVQMATAGAATKILGIARKGYSGTENTAVPVELIDPAGLYVATYSGTSSQALVGDLLDFTFTAGAHTLLETSATTDVYCVGLYDAASSGGRLIVRFLSAQLTSQF